MKFPPDGDNFSRGGFVAFNSNSIPQFGNLLYNYSCSSTSSIEEEIYITHLLNWVTLLGLVSHTYSILVVFVIKPNIMSKVCSLGTMANLTVYTAQRVQERYCAVSEVLAVQFWVLLNVL